MTCDLRHTLVLTMASICGSRVSGPPFITYTAMVVSSADLRGGVHLGGGREWQVRLYSWLLLTWLTSPLGSPASARLIAMASYLSSSTENRSGGSCARPGSELEDEDMRSALGFPQERACDEH